MLIGREGSLQTQPIPGTQQEKLTAIKLDTVLEKKLHESNGPEKHKEQIIPSAQNWIKKRSTKYNRQKTKKSKKRNNKPLKQIK